MKNNLSLEWLESAFPMPALVDHHGTVKEPGSYGLSKREFYSIECLKGLLGAHATGLSVNHQIDIVNTAVEFADLLSQRLSGAK